MGDIVAVAAGEPLDGGERVARLCFAANIAFGSGATTYPDQIDPESGLIRIEEISFSEITKGFSVQRIRLYARQEAEAMASERQERWRQKGYVDAEFRLEGVLVANVTDIHGISCPNAGQIFEVLAKPNNGDPGHAEVHFKAKLKKDEFLEHRLALQKVLGRLVDAAVLDEAA